MTARRRPGGQWCPGRRRAITVWQQAGAPDQTAFGMTVTEEEQIVWLGSPDGPHWRLLA
ncbi:hypothetical protein ACFXAZ_37675 [Streptomyces sp. NPDC059477]|uniref:hypothetical protein n=1 Tax=Streptomyces sp. NPDC059477 TaxID=3346847 RepID=UPI0036B9916C